jgi:hypothetical protein
MALIEEAYTHQKGSHKPYSKVVEILIPDIKQNVLDHVRNEILVRQSRAVGEAATALAGMAEWIAKGAQ